jgi:hypothetical protein
LHQILQKLLLFSVIHRFHGADHFLKSGHGHRPLSAKVFSFILPNSPPAVKKKPPDPNRKQVAQTAKIIPKPVG